MLRYQFLPQLPHDGPLLSSLLELLSLVFNNKSADEHLAELQYQQARTPLQLWLALQDERVVGFKIGYERKPGHYYSWLGAVSPQHRGQGVAAELMRQQHAWCRVQGYERIRTQTYNRWRAMLILNLRFDFSVIGTVQGPHGLTLVLELPL